MSGHLTLTLSLSLTLPLTLTLTRWATTSWHQRRPRRDGSDLGVGSAYGLVHCPVFDCDKELALYNWRRAVVSYPNPNPIPIPNPDPGLNPNPNPDPNPNPNPNPNTWTR